MDRLKQGGDSGNPDGELITRPDGTRIIRKRRRKRRTEQPHKKEQARKKKMLLWKIGLLAGFLFLLLMSALLLFAKYNSRGYLQETEATIGDWTGGDIRVNGFKVSPVSAVAHSVKGEWPGDSFLRNLEMTKLKADLKVTNLAVGNWEGREVFAEKGTLSLKKPAADPKIGERLPAAEAPYNYERYRCEKLEVLFGSTPKDAKVRITGMEALLSHLEGGDFSLTCQKGKLAARGFGETAVGRGTFFFRPGSLEVTSFRLKDPSGTGEAVLSGSIPLRLGNKASLSVKTEDFPVATLMGKKFGRLFDGRVHSEKGVFLFSIGEYDSHELSLPFSSLEMSISNFPFLTFLAELLSEGNYARPAFSHKVEGMLRKHGDGRISAEGLHLEKSGFLVLKGGFAADAGGRLAGEFVMGLPHTQVTAAERYLAAQRGGVPRPLPFTPLEDGYRWMKFRVGGTLDRPVDNFAELLRSEAAPPAPGAGGAEPADPGETFEELTR